MASPDLALAARWAGDRIVMLRKGETVSVIWLLAFREADSAARFAAVYRKVLDHLHGHPAAHRVELKGNAVLVVIGETAAHFDTLGPAVWKASVDHGSAAGDYSGRSVASCWRVSPPLRAASPACRRALMRSRPSRRLDRSAALVLLTFAGCAYGVVSGGRVNVQRAEQIYSDVQELRQLNFNADVPLVLMDQGQANLVLERELTRHHDEADLQRSAEVGVLTGLYAPGTNLKAQTMRVLSSQVVGFYDPQDREMILVKGKSQPGLSSEISGIFQPQGFDERDAGRARVDPRAAGPVFRRPCRARSNHRQ